LTSAAPLEHAHFAFRQPRAELKAASSSGPDLADQQHRRPGAAASRPQVAPAVSEIALGGQARSGAERCSRWA
jgi:hypothetical protein